MKEKRYKKYLGVMLSTVMLLSVIPVTNVNAGNEQNYLTDENGVQQAEVYKMSSQNHEIIDINITDGKTHKVTIYLLDEDASGRWTMVDVIDPDTQKILDNQNIYDFSEGVYLSYNISGHMQIRLTNVWTKRYTSSKDTAVHGVFVDGKDALADGTAVVTTEKAKENADAKKLECINVLGRFVDAGKNFELPFDKEVQSVEMRFDGSVAPDSENIDQIKVLKDGKKVEGEMRTSFNSVTFKPKETMKDGAYEVVVPSSLKNTAGKEIDKEYKTVFEVKTSADVVYFLNGMNLQTKRVELTFNDRIKSAPKTSLVFNKGGVNERAIKTGDSGQNGGKSYEIQTKILPSGKYTFTLPKGVETVSGAKSAEDYVKEFEFDSTQLSASVDIPKVVREGDTFDLSIEECIGYGEVRYAFSEESIKGAAYVPVQEMIEVDPKDLTGDQTLYVQFRVDSGSKKGTESPLLHKAMKLGVVEEGEIRTFDMESAGAYDKDGFGSENNPTDGVFDLADDKWIEGPGGTSNYIADGSKGFAEKLDPEKDGLVTTEDGIPYQLSKNIYVDGKPNVATANGKIIPVPTETEYSKIYILAAGKADSNKGTFVMNYTDGTQTQQEIDVHYWGGENAPVDNIVFKKLKVCLGWSDNWIGEMGVMRQYILEPDSEKVLESVTLPETSQLVRVFAMTGKEADKIAGKDVASQSDMTSCETGESSREDIDLTYDEFMELYGDEPELVSAADVTDVTNIKEVPAGDRNYDPEILKELDTETGAYGQSLYPYARQPEKLMSYKIRMQIYGQTNNNNYELDFEDALETIRRVDNLTRGIDKKCYLVGWQTNGHDTGFPYFGEVNPRHRRPMDKTSLESLKWLIKEAKDKYNTTITLHVNFSDAYTDDDPISQGMLEDQIAIRESNGKIRETSTWAGHKGFMVSAYGNYFTGNWQEKQIDPLLEMLPELEGQSVHPDAWYSQNDPYYGLDSYDTTDAQRRSAKYMREKYNMDLTTEFDVAFGAGESHPEDHILYFPMIWQRGWSKTNPLMTPAYFQSGVNETSWDGQTLSASGRYFGEGTAVEPNLWNGTYGPINLPGLKQSFAEKELTRQYLNTLLRTSLEDDEATGGVAKLYTDDGQIVTSVWNGDNSATYKRTVTVGDDVVLQEPGNVFMPMTWRSGLEIQSWSKAGYSEKKWKLPVEWEDVEKVDVYDLNFEGLRFVESLDVTNRNITMDMNADQTVILVPEGQNPNSTEGFAQNGSVQFVETDKETSGNWTEKYGKEGYELFDGELGENIPEEVKISYVNGQTEGIQTGVIAVEKVTLDKEVAELEIGGKLMLQATVSPDNATEKNVVWTSSNPDVATVSPDGEVEALAWGVAVITARAGNCEANCTINVKSNVSTDALEKLLEQAEKIDRNKYTEKSLEVLDEAIQAVKDGLKEELTQERVNELYNQLKAALNGLEQKQDQPDGTDDLDQPGEQDKVDGKDNADQQKSSVKTGDVSSIWGTLAVIFVAAGVAVLVFRRRNNADMR